MANRERGELRLVARQRAYVLRLTVSSVCALEERTGRTLGEVITSINAGSATDLRWLFWAALQDRHAGEAETLEDAGVIGNSVGGIDGIMAALGRLIQVNEDDSRDDPTNEPADAPTEPGSRWRRLYIDARVAGLSPEQFWGLSLRELWLERAAQRERDRDELKRDKVLAWTIAMLGRAEKVPPLDQFIGQKSTAPARQSWQDMKAMVSALGAVAAQK